MPKIRPLTDADRKLQAENEAVENFCRKVMDQINMERGLKDMTRKEMAERLGISKDTYLNWRDGGICKASVDHLIRAAHRVGCRIEIIPEK